LSYITAQTDSSNGPQLDHVHTFNHPKNLELLAEFRQVLDNKTAEDTYNPRLILFKNLGQLFLISLKIFKKYILTLSLTNNAS
jgi:hypothetical protein